MDDEHKTWRSESTRSGARSAEDVERHSSDDLGDAVRSCLFPKHSYTEQREPAIGVGRSIVDLL